MLDPVGPLPASVYWRRRAVAVGVALVAFFAMLWLTTWLLLPSGSDARTAPAAQSTPDEPAAAPASPAPGAPQAPLPTPADPGAPPADPAEVPPGPAAPDAVPGGGAPAAPDAGGAAPPPVPGPDGPPVDEAVRPDDTPRPSVPVPQAEPSPPTGPVPCTDGMIEVRAETGQPAYPAGARPELRLVVTNTSGQPCVRDLDGAEQEIAVWSGDGANRLWSSNDCTNPATDDLRTLVPGQPVAFAVTWSGLASAPGCGGDREQVAPGGYRVLARLGPVVSEPVPLLLG